MGLFEALNKSERPTSADELAKQTGGEKLPVGKDTHQNTKQHIQY